MAYFEDHCQSVNGPFVVGGENGLRQAQVGAISAVVSHFTLHGTPALVVMPTGSGKTIVLQTGAYLLRPNRVLVVTPSVLVRGQLAEQFRTLQTMRSLGVIGKDVPPPVVHEVTGRIRSADEWEALNEADVVVATPQSISPALADVAEPPEGLFDLLLIDEAHHSPAKTWQAVQNSFPKARQILTTATPFRLDSREIRGKVVYNYPLRNAFNDGIFGRVEFLPVDPGDDNHDVCLAKAAEAALGKDRAAGYSHLLMVRTDSKKRGRDLKDIYAQHTGLRLQLVDSDHSLSHVKGVIGKLKNGQLDGVICVDMMGEGFDLPNLKIAAIHSPHKSLAVTLQFIGRFARTNAPDIGTARFLAIPSEISGDTQALYKEDAVWQDIITGLAEQRIAAEVHTREVIGRFAAPKIITPDVENVSLYSLTPSRHVKVYRAGRGFDINAEVTLPPGYEILLQKSNPDDRTIVLITRQSEMPRWTKLEQFARQEYDLFVIYYDEPSGLLFINASARTEDLYQHVAKSFCAAPRKLPLYQLDRVLADLNDAEFFNIGMRNSVLNDNTESYRIITGASAQSAIQPTDGEGFHRGHVFGRATVDNEVITIGYSSSSRIWSGASSSIPGLIDWCKWLAERLARNATVRTNTALDYLRVGTELKNLPQNVISADWHEDEYVHPRRVDYTDATGNTVTCLTIDMDLTIDRSNATEHSIRVVVSHGSAAWHLDFSLRNNDYFADVTGDAGSPAAVEHGGRAVPLAPHINDYPLSFYLADMSRFCMSELFPFNEAAAKELDLECVECIDWDAGNVDIQVEYGTPDPKLSLHDYLKQQLVGSDAEAVFYDHTNGEIADFITFSEENGELVIRLYHCKPSKEAQPGHRVEDLYEVIGQVVKCTGRFKNHRRLLEHMRRRAAKTVLPKYEKGDEAVLGGLLERTRAMKTSYEIVVVQPGLSKRRLPEELKRIIGSASEYVVRTRSGRLRVMASH